MLVFLHVSLSLPMPHSSYINANNEIDCLLCVNASLAMIYVVISAHVISILRAKQILIESCTDIFTDIPNQSIGLFYTSAREFLH